MKIFDSKSLQQAKWPWSAEEVEDLAAMPDGEDVAARSEKISLTDDARCKTT
jgi:hypothetical protein